MVWVLIIGVLGAGAYGKHSSEVFIFVLHTLVLPMNALPTFLLGIWHCYWEYDNYKQQSASITDVGFSTNFKIYLQVQETWLAFCECDLYFTTLNVQCRILYLMAFVDFRGIVVCKCKAELLNQRRSELQRLQPCPVLGPSDHHLCGGGSPAPNPHLPPDQNPHRHRPHPGVQQVRRDVTHSHFKIE